jgi:hypothetical protein
MLLGFEVVSSSSAGNTHVPQLNKRVYHNSDNTLSIYPSFVAFRQRFAVRRYFVDEKGKTLKQSEKQAGDRCFCGRENFGFSQKEVTGESDVTPPLL